MWGDSVGALWGASCPCFYNLSSSKDALLEKERSSEIFFDQILFLLENSDGPYIFELFDRETNFGKMPSVSTRALVGEILGGTRRTRPNTFIFLQKKAQAQV